MTAFEAYTEDAKTDLAPQFGRIRKSRAQAIYLPNYSNQDLLQQVREARQAGIQATFLFTEGLNANRFPGGNFPPELEGGYFTSSRQSTSEESQKFRNLFRQRFSEDPDKDALQAYDAFGLIFQAVESQRKADPESIQKGLHSLGSYQGISGPLLYKESGDPIVDIAIMRIQKGGAEVCQVVQP